MTDKIRLRPAPGTCCPESRYEFVGQVCARNYRLISKIYRCQGCGHRVFETVDLEDRKGAKAR